MAHKIENPILSKLFEEKTKQIIAELNDDESDYNIRKIRSVSLLSYHMQKIYQLLTKKLG